MLTEAQAASVQRTSEPGFHGVEFLLRPENWPECASPTPQSGSPVPFGTRSRSSSVVSLSFQPPKTNTPSHIAVLDSSFNPPTLAHLVLASSAFPPPMLNPNVRRSRGLSSPKSPSAILREAATYFSSHGVSPDGSLAPAPKDEVTNPDPAPGPYTARLLMFAAKNADKTPGWGDASPIQRAELMLAQAEAMPPQAGPVAVAIVAEPTFAAKAKMLVRVLEESGAWSTGHEPREQHRSEPSTPRVRALTSPSMMSPVPPASPSSPAPSGHLHLPAITFLVGMDTLERIFDAKYYPHGRMDAAMEELFQHAWLVCARRGSGGESTDAADTRRLEDNLLARADVARWVARGRIRLIRAPEAVADVSSTRVRMALRMGAGAGALRGLCADPVSKYLLEQRMYRS
ncbi:hypothetical protein CcaverHIS002_0606610 [Cutaneotrichosporon cavernicola]|uniref:Nicotinamide-nucleotide adenylyltransferase n=1 Tax=Cutaneotrichosporon cavernicola TaxID=279322 RepID=A0AA48L8L4_9TREE|nr:uncharacterized protein CcaverHIS019_0606050 [Cutaneotrichosporon cavernicola]BEI86374.1 hypothetical protein CcaverHIS002_0606610 [Cutaneotrichosporon cavernicola]BEI94146.1 hypothetical protein CcaverHIS019_0606050 [Cutaneotrichosporon cavernicola]BEJ01926.1 hypothetical protein CcaverHIS631_0606080 [Cutaneotrichosporon cavernicola]BEJ09690.1 hypothetical protein CcaverHIS641_0606050 [Cutaneotrichosporon cavernicola]